MFSRNVEISLNYTVMQTRSIFGFTAVHFQKRTESFEEQVNFHNSTATPTLDVDLLKFFSAQNWAGYSVIGSRINKSSQNRYEGSRVSYVCKKLCSCVKWARPSGQNCVPRNLEFYRRITKTSTQSHFQVRQGTEHTNIYANRKYHYGALIDL
jgi:hypothetical protein